MRFWTTLALLTAIMGGAAITATADAYTCATSCQGGGGSSYARSCTTSCF